MAHDAAVCAALTYDDAGVHVWERLIVTIDSATYGTDPELTAATCCTQNDVEPTSVKATTSAGCCG